MNVLLRDQSAGNSRTYPIEGYLVHVVFVFINLVMFFWVYY